MITALKIEVIDMCVSRSGIAISALAALTALRAAAGVTLVQEDRMDVMVLSNRFGTASISLRGAQVRSYKPAGMTEDVLFGPKTMAFEGTKDNRGGIPVCWPWFGRNGEPGSKPHGFARYSLFEVRGQEEDADGTTLTLGLRPTDDTRKVWPYDFDLEYKIRLGATLDLSLRTRNTDARAVKITEGLHPYWRVSDRRKVRVDGLDGCPYCFADVSQVADRTWKGTFVPDGHFDHVFTLAKREQTITDTGWGRSVLMRGSGYSKIVIWTPDVFQAGQFENLSPEDILRFVCVEPATLFRPDAYTLSPGEEHVLSVSIAVKRQ